MKLTISITPHKVALLLLRISIALTIASLAAGVINQVWHDGFAAATGLFRLNQEQNIPTWYASATLFLAAILLSMIAIIQKMKGAPFVRRWFGLAFIFLFFSVDETATIHELSIVPLRTTFQFEGFLYYSWVVPAALFIMVFAILYARFFLNLDPEIRHLFMVAALIYIGGALGFEMVSGYVRDFESFIALALLITIEEFLEMIGVTVFIYALLKYLAGEASNVNIEFKAQSDSATTETSPVRHRSQA